MILRYLELKEFRGFKTERIDFDPRLTVIVGANGAGKTSVLDAIWILLDQYTARLLGSRTSARRLVEGDARFESDSTLIGLSVDNAGQEVRWALRKQGRKQKVLKPLGSDLADLNELVRSIAERAFSETDYLRDAVLPIYYDQRRALADIPQRKRSKAKHDAQDAFVESRERRLDFRGFVYWFEEREAQELRKQRSNPDYEDPQLASVRSAIRQSTNLANLSYRPIPPRGLTVKKKGIELRVDQLSTGERVFLAMAGDLARRLAMLAGDCDNPRQTRAVVLIDEVELHLHPSWQRKILPWLLKAFPHCQFVVTTHSPQVIGDIKADQIRVLDFKSKGNQAHAVAAAKGRDSNFLLLSVFGAEERSATSKSRFAAFEKAVRDDDLAAASRELERLSVEIEGGAPELAVARSRLERRKASS